MIITARRGSETFRKDVTPRLLFKWACANQWYWQYCHRLFWWFVDPYHLWLVPAAAGSVAISRIVLRPLIASMATLALNSGLWLRRLLISGSPFQGRYPASKVNDGPYPEKTDHLRAAEYQTNETSARLGGIATKVIQMGSTHWSYFLAKPQLLLDLMQKPYSHIETSPSMKDV